MQIDNDTRKHPLFGNYMSHNILPLPHTTEDLTLQILELWGKGRKMEAAGKFLPFLDPKSGYKNKIDAYNVIHSYYQHYFSNNNQNQ